MPGNRINTGKIHDDGRKKQHAYSTEESTDNSAEELALLAEIWRF